MIDASIIAVILFVLQAFEVVDGGNQVVEFVFGEP